MKRNARAHASSTAFFFFMSMIPLLIILASIVPLFNISINDILNFFREILPVGAVSLVESVLREAFDHCGLAFSASALILLWTASRGVSAPYSMEKAKRKQGWPRAAGGIPLPADARLLNVTALITDY